MKTFDYKKELAQLYLPSKREFSIVTVPEMKFLMADGHGDPNFSPEFQELTNALYTTAYTIKFSMKSQGFEFAVPPLEGLWWMEDMREFNIQNKHRWDWTLMIMQPDFVTQQIFEQARQQAMLKKGLPALQQLRFESYNEGMSIQILYLGAYANEGPTISRMHTFISEHGYETNGKHHEIYLGDHRRTAPEKLKTVIRQPIRIHSV